MFAADFTAAGVLEELNDEQCAAVTPRDEELEASYRKRTPEAAFRSISYDADGQFDPGDEPERRVRRPRKYWRGYRLTVGSDLVTGLPLSGTLYPADTHETHSIAPMLDLLYSEWPTIPLRAVVADKLWDDDPTHRRLEEGYGVQLVAVRRPSHLAKGGRRLDKSGDPYRGGVARVDGNGVAWCRQCGGQMLYDGLNAPSREGLVPGERASTRFRSRFRCPDCGRRPSVPTDRAWSALPYFPHNPLGRPDLHAYRLALLGQRNVAESCFSSLKGSFAQGLAGGRRTRVFNREVYESLIWLSLLTRALLMLPSERQARDRLLAA